MKKRIKVAIAGAGIYGSTIAIKLARKGIRVTLYDPLGIMCAASAINQLRVHSGYHYPRSPETIVEILEARNEFISEYREAIVNAAEHYYAIPYEGSKTRPEEYEKICDSFSLSLKPVEPKWINFDFIDRCYLVNESLYDPGVVKALIEERISRLGIRFLKQEFSDKCRDDSDFVVWATYGASGSHRYSFDRVALQVAEKILIKLPVDLQRKSLVVVDGPFVGFDPYGNTEYSQFGSGGHTNHWVTFEPAESIPEGYAALLNGPAYLPVNFSHFSKMVSEAKKAVPLCGGAEYIGSRFTLRVVEHNPAADRRVFRITRSDNKTFYVFSGKVSSAVKAANIITEQIVNA